MRRPIDVEELTKWACAQELPRKPTGKIWQAPAIFAGMLPRRDASLVGRWHRPPGFPSISPTFAGGFASCGAGPGAPPDADALIVDAAIGMLDASMKDLAAPDELALGIGLPVDIDGAWAAALAQASNLVLCHGRLGNRPSVALEPPVPRPRLAPNGKPGVWKRFREFRAVWPAGDMEVEFEGQAQRVRRGVYPEGSYCSLIYEPDPQWIVNDRAGYLVWRIALERLAEALSGRLARFGALPPAAAFAPWRGDRDGSAIPDLFGPGASGVRSSTDVGEMHARAGQRRKFPTSGDYRRRPTRPARAIAKD